MIQVSPDFESVSDLIVIQNWFEELKLMTGLP
jgi:hypothetical protein